MYREGGKGGGRWRKGGRVLATLYLRQFSLCKSFAVTLRYFLDTVKTAQHCLIPSALVLLILGFRFSPYITMYIRALVPRRYTKKHATDLRGIENSRATYLLLDSSELG